jgi:biotin operon repressor
MVTKKSLLKYLKARQPASGRELTEAFGISRQAINKHLKGLIENGKVCKEGTTKGTVYTVHSAADKKDVSQKFRKRYVLEGLEEHVVFNECETSLQLRKNISHNVFDIVRYAFTEMMNNAIEHSESKPGDVEFFMNAYDCGFKIKDYGIGIFYSVFKKLSLPDESAAVGELLKGKTTTMKERHTGEGVFFTSKSGDHIIFRSHRAELVFDNKVKDVFMTARRFTRGTEVSFRISRNSKRKLGDIFNLYAPAEYEHRFEKTRVFVALYHKELMSRSEARRMLNGLDKFREIIIDFLGVRSIGQGFADEIFRVFRKVHPDIAVRVENLNPSLQPIIRHAIENGPTIPL